MKDWSNGCLNLRVHSTCCDGPIHLFNLHCSPLKQQHHLSHKHMFVGQVKLSTAAPPATLRGSACWVPGRLPAITWTGNARPVRLGSRLCPAAMEAAGMSGRKNRKPACRNHPKVKLGLTDLDHSRSAVLESLRSPESKRGYRQRVSLL